MHCSRRVHLWSYGSARLFIEIALPTSLWTRQWQSSAGNQFTHRFNFFRPCVEICGDIATFLFDVRSVMVHEICLYIDRSGVSGSGSGTDLLSSTLHRFRQEKRRGPALNPAPYPGVCPLLASSALRLRPSLGNKKTSLYLHGLCGRVKTAAVVKAFQILDLKTHANDSRLCRPSEELPQRVRLNTNLDEAREAGDRKRHEKEEAQGPLISLPSGVK